MVGATLTAEEWAALLIDQRAALAARVAALEAENERLKGYVARLTAGAELLWNGRGTFEIPDDSAILVRGDEDGEWVEVWELAEGERTMSPRARVIADEEQAELRAENAKLRAELTGIGRCGAHRAATGDQCLRENDHEGGHIFERETDEALARLRALEGEVLAEGYVLEDELTDGASWIRLLDERHIPKAQRKVRSPYMRRARLVAAEPPEEEP